MPSPLPPSSGAVYVDEEEVLGLEVFLAELDLIVGHGKQQQQRPPDQVREGRERHMQSYMPQVCQGSLFRG